MATLWRKFEFFEDKAAARGRGGGGGGGGGSSAAVPADIAGRVTCCSGSRSRVAVGCDDGTVGLLDCGFRLSYGFQAHASSVLFLQQLKQRNVLVTVGDVDQSSSQSSPICLKVFDLDKVQEEGSSTTTPLCVQILRVFTDHFPQAKITSFMVLEEAPPILLIAIGLDNGLIYCIKGDIARERITRFKLQVEAASDGSTSLPITGLGFRVEGQAHQLFAVTPSSVTLFNLHVQPPRRQTLDQIGCQTNAVAMSDRMDLIIGRPEAVYFYEVDGRGPCWAFDGEKKLVGWFRGYLLCIIEDQRTLKGTLNVYDLKNRLIAHSMPVGDVSHLVCEWGYVILIMADKKILCIGEKDMESKLDMLFKKNLYTVAINLVQSQQADPALTGEVLQKYGDHLYGKQEYDEAMSQYIHTIGYLEPPYVIQKFLDAKRIYNLTNYLEMLHDRGLASKDHTTLLLNCYTKLKDVEKLNDFIKDEDGIGEIKFDVETAIRVCHAAGYHEHAMFVAKKAGRHELYLKFLLEDLGRYDEALQYISSLEANQAGLTAKEYGKILVEHRPAETVEILLRLAQYLMEFLENYIKANHNTKETNGKETTNGYKSGTRDKANLGEEDTKIAKSIVDRRRKGLALLKSAWTSEMQDPLYDVDLALILCNTHAFKDGLFFLYEKLKLYKEVISCYKQAHDHQGLIACCKKLGGSSQGGDPSLWAVWGDLLKYFGELEEDCSKEVKEVLTYIEKEDVVPHIVVLQTLSKNPCLTLSVVKDYIARKLEQESKFIEDDRKSIESDTEETELMKREIEDLKTNVKVFQLSKCTACTFTLDLPAVHFMRMHSFHLRCLGDNEKECPECAPEYRSVMEAKQKLEQNARDHDLFFRQLRGSKDGFSVVADYFSKGIVSKTTVPPKNGRYGRIT
ncbi:hypothetical protein PVAP13_7NG132300, partial [Panicum virgatum]